MISLNKKTKSEEPIILESEVTLISAQTSIQGVFQVSGVTRISGSIQGKIQATPGSELILMESSMIEAELEVDTVIINGFVRGNVQAQKKIVLEKNARVIGHLFAPSIQIEFGAFLDGEVKMPEEETSNQSV